MKLINYLIVSVFIFTLSGCTSSQNKELMRMTSPDKTFDAVLAMSPDEGAMVSTRYYLYVIPHGQKSEKNSPSILEGDHFDWLGFPHLIWHAPHDLEIEYSTGYIEYFTDCIWDTNGCSRIKLIYTNPNINPSYKINFVLPNSQQWLTDNYQPLGSTSQTTEYVSKGNSISTYFLGVKKSIEDLLPEVISSDSNGTTTKIISEQKNMIVIQKNYGPNLRIELSVIKIFSMPDGLYDIDYELNKPNSVNPKQIQDAISAVINAQIVKSSTSHFDH